MMKTIEGFLTTPKKVHEDPVHEKQDKNPKKEPRFMKNNKNPPYPKKPK